MLKKLFSLLPLGGMIGVGYLIWKLIELIIFGVIESNWLMVIAGGLLVYVFLGFLIMMFVLCLYVFVWLVSL